MNSTRRLFHTVVFGWLYLLASLTTAANQITVSSTDNLQQVLDHAPPDTTLLLQAGTYYGNFIASKPFTISGQPGAIIDAQGKGDALRVKAPNTTVEGLRIINWGDNLTAMNAGIFVEKTAQHVVIQNNSLFGDTTGIWLDKCDGATIIHNKIQGNNTMRSTDRGNGIHLSVNTNAKVIENEVWHTRDGLYIISSQNNELINNNLHDLRYGIHYMYSNNNIVTHNKTRRTRAGYALMQSRQLTVLNNESVDNIDYGILLNFITQSTLENNLIDGVNQPVDEDVSGADGKGFFVYNSLSNQIVNNVIKDAEIGIHLTAGSEGNTISGNNFINNHTQVKYVASRLQEWSKEGRGNYWSNYMGWDMNNDDIGDNPFEPNDNVDKLLWKYPQAKVLMNSPAILLLRYVQRQFPVIKSPGVKDSYPMMRPSDRAGVLP